MAENVRTFTNQFLGEHQIPRDSVVARFEFALRGFTARMSEAKVRALSANPQIKYIQQDARFRAISPIEVSLSDSTLNNSNLTNKSSGDEVLTWNIINVNGPIDGTGLKAWILDTGIDLDHPDLNVDVTNSKSFIPSESPDDLNGHGTHVAGILAAKANGIDVIGVAKGATVISVKVINEFGDATTTSICEGVGHVMTHANSNDIINMSLRIFGGDVSIDQAVTNAAEAGLRFTIAAGNDGIEASQVSPARVNHPNVYTVSAFGLEAGEYVFASFSNFGNPPVDYSEPGVDIFSLWKNGKTKTISGTSMASPHLGGILLAAVTGVDTSGTVISDRDETPDPIGVVGASDLNAYILGPSFVSSGIEETWSAETSGGIPPFEYTWYRNVNDPPFLGFRRCRSHLFRSRNRVV